MSVYKKLQQARLKLQSTALKKSGKNKFAGFEYFELGDFLPTIQTIFNEVGLCGTVSFGTDIATLNIVDTDDVTQSIVFTSPMSTAELKGCHAIQNLGAVQTYLRRYLWVAAMEIVEHDAVDAVTGRDEVKKAEPTSESPKIVGLKGEWQIIAPAKPDKDVQAWLELVRDASHLQLSFATKPEDILAIFRKNKLLFDEIKLTNEAFFKDVMLKFTEVKNKLEGK